MKRHSPGLILMLLSVLITSANAGCRAHTATEVKPTATASTSPSVSTTLVVPTTTSAATPSATTTAAPSSTTSQTIVTTSANPTTIISTTGTVTSAPDVISIINYLFLNGAKIFSQDKRHTFLGTISDKYNSDSIFNEFGDYGSQYSWLSIWNKFGDYGGKLGVYSPFNQSNTNPAEIYLGTTFYGYVSVNKYQGYISIAPNELLEFAFLKYNDASYLDLKIL